MEYNAWSYIMKITKPNPKISQISQKNEKIWKIPKPKSKMHECMEREKIRTLTKCFELEIGQKRGG